MSLSYQLFGMLLDIKSYLCYKNWFSKLNGNEQDLNIKVTLEIRIQDRSIIIQLLSMFSIFVRLNAWFLSGARNIRYYINYEIYKCFYSCYSSGVTRCWRFDLRRRRKGTFLTFYSWKYYDWHYVSLSSNFIVDVCKSCADFKAPCLT